MRRFEWIFPNIIEKDIDALNQNREMASDFLQERPGDIGKEKLAEWVVFNLFFLPTAPIRVENPVNDMI